jgi:hypothetical protein
LQEIWSLLHGKFEREALQQKWVCKMVRYFYFHLTIRVTY